MLKMFQPKTSRRELERQLTELRGELAAARQDLLEEKTRADNLDRELIAAKADRRRVEAEIADLKANVESLPKSVIRRHFPRVTPVATSAEKQADRISEQVGLGKKLDAMDRAGEVYDAPPVSASASVETHPDYIAAKAEVDKALKHKKGGIGKARVALKEVRHRLFRDGLK